MEIKSENRNIFPEFRSMVLRYYKRSILNAGCTKPAAGEKKL